MMSGNNGKKKTGPKGPSKYTQEFIENEAVALVQYVETESLPFLKKFAVDRGYGPERLSEFGHKNEKFSQALKKAHVYQEHRFMLGTLAGKLNPAMAIFALKNIAGLERFTYDRSISAHSLYESRSKDQ